MNKRTVLLRLILITALAGFICSGCTTTQKAGVVIQEGATKGSQQVGETTADVGEKVEDATITSAIKMKFASDKLASASNIHVDTQNGHVTLAGPVSSETEATRALQIGRSVEGVKTVRSKLIIALKRS